MATERSESDLRPRPGRLSTTPDLSPTRPLGSRHPRRRGVVLRSRPGRRTNGEAARFAQVFLTKGEAWRWIEQSCDELTGEVTSD